MTGSAVIHTMWPIRWTVRPAVQPTMKKYSRKEFLIALFGNYFERQNGFVIIKSTRHVDRKVSTRYFPNVEILAKEHYMPDQDVFFGVCPRETMKSDKSHIRFVTALWAGLDLGPDGYSGKNVFFSGPASAAKAVRSFPLPPSIIVESGWGMHLYWLLSDIVETTEKDRVERILRRISDYFQCKYYAGMDAMLRLPGTFNCKMAGKSVPCAIKYMNTDFSYRLEEFEQIHLGPEIDATPKIPDKEAQPVQPQEIIAEIGPQAYEDAVEQAPGRDDVRNYLVTEPDDKIATDIEPLFYESPQKSQDSCERVLSDDFVERMADQIVDRVVENLSKKLIDELADEIVARLATKLISG